MNNPTMYNTCPKCKKATATSKLNDDGSGHFYCVNKSCKFDMPTHKQDMSAAVDQLAAIKKKFFNFP